MDVENPSGKEIRGIDSAGKADACSLSLGRPQHHPWPALTTRSTRRSPLLVNALTQATGTGVGRQAGRRRAEVCFYAVFIVGPKWSRCCFGIQGEMPGNAFTGSRCFRIMLQRGSRVAIWKGQLARVVDDADTRRR